MDGHSGALAFLQVWTPLNFACTSKLQSDEFLKPRRIMAMSKLSENTILSNHTSKLERFGEQQYVHPSQLLKCSMPCKLDPCAATAEICIFHVTGVWVCCSREGPN